MEVLGKRISDITALPNWVDDGRVLDGRSARVDETIHSSWKGNDMSHAQIDRRGFLRASAVAMTAPALGSSLISNARAAGPLKGRIYLTLKYGMIGEKNLSMADKFKLVKDLGFDGVEVNAPGTNIAEAVEASDQSGLAIDGTVCSTHWRVRLSDPSEEVREQALQHFLQAIRDTKKLDGHTCLIVVGHGKDGTADEVWRRSTQRIQKAIPLASRLGVYIAVENVWNQFCYNHEGGADQDAGQFVKYIDELNSPWVAMQYDIGNHQKYGNPGDWIRQLGSQRIVKLDLKGFDRSAGKFMKIGEGDIDWADVRAALHEIGFVGWAAAEVRGGDRNRLKEVRDNMVKVFGL